MPHVVLEGTIGLNDLQGRLSPVMERNESEILKTGDFYLNQTGNSALLEAIVIENGSPKNFFVHLSKKENSLTVRLFPLTDPEKPRASRNSWASSRRKSENCFLKAHSGRPTFRIFWPEVSSKHGDEPKDHEDNSADCGSL